MALQEALNDPTNYRHCPVSELDMPSKREIAIAKRFEKITTDCFDKHNQYFVNAGIDVRKNIFQKFVWEQAKDSKGNYYNCFMSTNQHVVDMGKRIARVISFEGENMPDVKYYHIDIDKYLSENFNVVENIHEVSFSEKEKFCKKIEGAGFTYLMFVYNPGAPVHYRKETLEQCLAETAKLSLPWD